jgi:hypothetical protein
MRNEADKSTFKGVPIENCGQILDSNSRVLLGVVFHTNRPKYVYD